MSDLDIRKVKKNIKSLETLEFNSYIESALARKLALIECCGWIEEKMHCILFNYIDRNVKKSDLQIAIKDSIRCMNYSFNYSNFRSKLVATLGETKIIKIEKQIQKYNNSKFDFEHFKSLLSSLKKRRDGLAHTYSRTGVTTTLVGFSEINLDIDYINKGLNIFQTFIKRIK